MALAELWVGTGAFKLANSSLTSLPVWFVSDLTRAPSLQIVDYNFMATLIALFGRYMPDFKRASAEGPIAAAPTAAGVKKAQ
jgi:hypothetical protein